jgi:4'-phosphopantetheinyl transferase EntD
MLALQSEQTTSLSKTLQGLLPPHACVVAGPLIDAPFTARERLSLGCASPHRRREFATGRAYAKQALAQLGFDDCDLPVGLDRAPEWPPGSAGSISHVAISHVAYGSNACVAAAVCRTDEIAAIGIDLESQHGLDPAIWRSVLTERELDDVLALPVPARRLEVAYRWCAKEAAAKTCKRRFEPLQIEIERDIDPGAFTAMLGGDPREVRHGRIAHWGDVCLATVVVKASAK